MFPKVYISLSDEIINNLVDKANFAQLCEISRDI